MEKLISSECDHTEALRECRLCPRNCGVDRLVGKTGYCGQGASIKAARAALHFWEEPVLSGIQPEKGDPLSPGSDKRRGSGAVFFSGCNLRCVFCQNHDIALGNAGKEITTERLAEIFFELKEKGAYNINLVTATPFIPQVCEALYTARRNDLDIPVIFNCGGYENVSALKMLDGLVDIYLPDMKYYSEECGRKYAKAPDYFEKSKLALSEMYRQVGEPVFGDDGMMKSGIIVRHLVLPGETANSKHILRYLHETYGDSIYISIMNQYTPMTDVLAASPECDALQNLFRKVTSDEYDRVVDFAMKIGIEKAFVQEGDTAEESFIPDFDYEGIDP